MPDPTPAVALLHGLPASGALWAGVAGQLDRATWAPDLPGYGARRPLPRGHHGVDDHLADLEAQRRAGGGPAWDSLHLVGTDYGGLLAAELALAAGARSLTLISTATGLGWAAPRALALPGLQRVAYQRYSGRRWVDRSVAPALRARFRAEVCGALADPELADRMRATAAALDLARCARLVPRLRASGTPVHLVWGDRDPHYPLWRARLAARRLRAPLTIVPGAGHAAPFSHPQAVAAALAAGWAALS